MNIVGIIPARGGSKGIPRKNLKLIAGKPLIVWSIESAKKSKLLNDFFVSTEDEEISRVAKRSGAKVINRPARLATDEASVLSVLHHAAKKTKADAILLLQPTSPIRGKSLIDDCIKEFINAKADSLATGFMCKYIPYGTKTKTFRRQDYKGFFYDDGNIYILKKDLLEQELKKGKKALEVIISKEENFEIDDETDLFIAGKILERRKQNE